MTSIYTGHRPTALPPSHHGWIVLNILQFYFFTKLIKFQISFHMPASCDGCTKQLWAPFRPPPAVECRRCRAKFHREHVVASGNNPQQVGEGVAPCKVNYDPTTAKDMLLMAPSAEEQQLWVSRLLKKIQKSGYKATVSAAAADTTRYC